MLEQILTGINGAVLLAFGITLSAAFSGIHPSKKNFLTFSLLYLFSGIVQLAVSALLSQTLVWQLYPLITHLPLILLLRTVYRRPTVAAMAATFTAYLFCQPAKWMGVLVYGLGGSTVWELVTRIVTLLPVGYIAVRYVACCLSEIFSKDRRSVLIFGIVPIVYYFFDYATVVYTNLWLSNDRAVMEFLPFFLAVAYVIFCFVYYREYEQKADAQRKEQIIRITVEQQAKEIAAVKQSEQEIRMLRHDMRLLLSSLALSIEHGETEKVLEMIGTQIDRIDGIRLERFCNVETLNYVLSDYAAKCKNAGIPFHCDIELDQLAVDEILFCSILSNALDNAVNAQKLLSPEKRRIRLMLKYSGSKLLLSVKNPVEKPVHFVDGLPVSARKGHGYGTQSIRYITERLGGNCQFHVQNGAFVVRVVL